MIDSKSTSSFRWWLLSGPLLLLIFVPLLVLIARGRGAIVDVWQDPAAWRALRLSLWTSLVTVGLTGLFGFPLAWLLSRYRFHGRRLLSALIELPIVLPPSVAGIALLLAFGRNGAVGQLLGLEIVFTPAAVILAQCFVGAPYFVRAAQLGFESIDPELEQSAALDGGNEWQILRWIVLPLSMRGLVAGLLLAWARALGEFGATIIFAGNLPGRTQTIPLAIFIGFEIDLDSALALSIVLLGGAFAVLTAVRLLNLED